MRTYKLRFNAGDMAILSNRMTTPAFRCYVGTVLTVTRRLNEAELWHFPNCDYTVTMCDGRSDICLADVLLDPIQDPDADKSDAEDESLNLEEELHR